MLGGLSLKKRIKKYILTLIVSFLVTKIVSYLMNEEL